MVENKTFSKKTEERGRAFSSLALHLYSEPSEPFIPSSSHGTESVELNKFKNSKFCCTIFVPKSTAQSEMKQGKHIMHQG